MALPGRVALIGTREGLMKSNGPLPLERLPLEVDQVLEQLVRGRDDLGLRA